MPNAAPPERLAVERAVAAVAPGTSGHGWGWWRAGLAEAVDRVPAGRPRPSAYEAARSPRSTRGATRA